MTPPAQAQGGAHPVDGTLTYYGESWIAAHARPAPGWVMIYSNACYAPGASEEHHVAADEVTAAGRVSAYSRGPLAELGASAYFATDFYEGAAHLVGALLDAPSLPYGDIFASEPRFDPAALVRLPHARVAGAEAWLHRSAYFDGKVDYWYAFAGDPTASLAGGGGAVAPLPRARCRVGTSERLRSSADPLSPAQPQHRSRSGRGPRIPGRRHRRVGRRD